MRHTRHAQGIALDGSVVRLDSGSGNHPVALGSNQCPGTQLGSGSVRPLTYDLHGNLTGVQHLVNEAAYDPFDRLCGVTRQAITSSTSSPPPDPLPLVADPSTETFATASSHEWHYLYDASGQRARKVRSVPWDGTGSPSENRLEERFYIGSFEVWRQYTSTVATASAAGAPRTERETWHVHADEQRLGMLEATTWVDGAWRSIDTSLTHPSTPSGVPVAPDVVWRLVLSDPLGSSTVEVTEAGLLISFEAYHPYGTTAVWAANAAIEVSRKRYRYTGMERDDESGFQYHAARYYVPWLGRWNRPDPIGVEGGVNLFAYAAGDPVGRFDTAGTKDQARQVQELSDGRVAIGEDGVRVSEGADGNPQWEVDFDGGDAPDAIEHASFASALGLDLPLRVAAERPIFVGRLPLVGPYLARVGTEALASRLPESVQTWLSDLPTRSMVPAVVGDVGALVGARQGLEGLASLSGVADDLAVASKAVGPSSKILGFTDRNIQKGFTKHGADFGLTGNWNPAKGKEFTAAVNQHINSPGVRAIEGIYRGNPVTHHLNPETGLNVMSDAAGNYVSGWQLGAEQLESVLSTGRLF